MITTLIKMSTSSHDWFVYCLHKKNLFPVSMIIYNSTPIPLARKRLSSVSVMILSLLFQLRETIILSVSLIIL